MSTRPPHRTSRFGQFVAEMKRRHVVRFALGYAAAAFVLLQLAEIVFPAFGIGEMGLRVMVIAVALLFPPAVVVAWIFDITVEGIRRTEELPDQGAYRPGSLTPRVALLVVTLGVAGATALWIGRVGLVGDADPPADAGSGGGLDLVAYDPGTPIRSLAVLPLENFSESGEQDYFSSGMHEELIAQLSQIGGLRVASRTSVSRYAGSRLSVDQIGRELQVDAVIEGSVRRDGDRVRITVQLIHAASDTHIWTEQYDRSLEDIFALQSEVALDIVSQIKAELSAEESSLLTRTASWDFDAEAQDAYLRGKFEYEKGTPEGFHAAMGHFEEAVDQDSTFAPALAGLAGTRFLLGMADEQPREEEMEQAAREALRALELDSMSMEAKEVVMLIREHIPEGVAPEGMGRITITGPAGHVSPEATVRVQGVQVLDTVWTAAMTQLGRRIEEVVRRQRLEAEGGGFAQRAFAVRQLLSAGLYDDAAQMLGSLAEERPGTPGIWPQLARVRVSAGDPHGALDAVARWSDTGEPGAPSSDDVRELEAAVAASGVQGYWSWTRGRFEALKAAGKSVPATEYAACLLAEGETEQALAVLEQAAAAGDRSLMSLRTDPVWDPVRADPRFAKVARTARSMLLPGPPQPPTGPGQRR